MQDDPRRDVAPVPWARMMQALKRCPEVRSTVSRPHHSRPGQRCSRALPASSRKVRVHVRRRGGDAAGFSSRAGGTSRGALRGGMPCKPGRLFAGRKAYGNATARRSGRRLLYIHDGSRATCARLWVSSAHQFRGRRMTVGGPVGRCPCAASRSVCRSLRIGLQQREQQPTAGGRPYPFLLGPPTVAAGPFLPRPPYF